MKKVMRKYNNYSAIARNWSVWHSRCLTNGAAANFGRWRML